MAKIYTVSGDAEAVKRRILELNELRHDFKYPIEILIEGHQMSYVFHDSTHLDYFRAGFECGAKITGRR